MPARCAVCLPHGHQLLHNYHTLCAAVCCAVLCAGKQHVLLNADNSSDLLYTLTHSPAGPRGEAFFEDLAGEGSRQ